MRQQWVNSTFSTSSKVSWWCPTAILEWRHTPWRHQDKCVSQNAQCLYSCESAQRRGECSPNCCSSSSEINESFAVQEELSDCLDFVKVFEILPKWSLELQLGNEACKLACTWICSAQRGGTAEEYLTWQWFTVSCCLDFLLEWFIQYRERMWRVRR